MAFLAAPIITTIVERVTSIIDKIIPDVAARDKMKADMAMELLKQDWSNVTAQLEINKVEAASSSVFVAGWRPAVGWTCVAGLAYSLVLQPFLVFLLVAFGKTNLPPLPELDITGIFAILGSLLGIGGLHTWERIKGVPTVGKK